MDKKNKTSPIEKIAGFIVDRRKGFYLVYILLIIFSFFSSGWVNVNDNITDYLPDATETRYGLTLMEDEFTTYAAAEIMVDNIAYADADILCGELSEISGIKEIAFDDTQSHYANGAALFSVTFDSDATDEITVNAYEEAEKLLEPYDTYIQASIGDADSKRMASEMNIVMIIACIIILAVLLISSHTYMEIPVLVMTFGVAAILNKGTNYMVGTISFISNSIAIVLQLALAIDYAIILCHRYTEERETKEAREAVITALCKAIPEISGSCLTTLSGLATMGFMQFKIGFDMSIVLVKAIIISIIVVFTLMPGLLMSFSPLIDKTHHKNFVPSTDGWSKLVIKARYVTPAIFGVLVVVCFFLSNNCPYAYSDTELSTITKNETQIARQMINDTFSRTNVLAVVIPSGDYEKEQLLKSELEEFDEVDSVTGLASVDAMDGYEVGDKLSPREFSELTDMDIEVVRLLYSAYAANDESYGRIVGGIDNYKIALLDMFDFVFDMIDDGYVSLDDEMQSDLNELRDKLSDGKKQLKSDEYSRLVVNLNIPEDGEEAFEFLSVVRNTAKKYYGDEVTLVGNTTSNYDMAASFSMDNIMISVLSIVFVLIVLFFTFQSAGLPIILILVIQGSIWINFSFPTIFNNPIYFMSYLVVSSIQMGANIDYAIVITNRYAELRREMPKLEAIKQSLNLAFPTVFTSGTILASAGFAISLFSSSPIIASVGSSLGRGTLISIILVMGILPQLLVLCDFIIEKTSFNLKDIRKDIKEHITTGGENNENKIISGFLAILMTFSLSCACFTASADGSVMYIKTAEDFINFSNHCTLDEHSQGLTAELLANIDFSGKNFVPVPIFCGTFKGNGYTISGISYSEKGSYKGVFRHLEKGASVSNLNVLASFNLNGSKSFLGGIAGENSGTVENCSFNGNLVGENVIGGIVGNNTYDGKIISCSAYGTVTGENSTGGICGKNSGFIQNCHNYASVNTVYEEKKTDISDIEADAAAIVENIKNSEDENKEEIVLGHTDTGGIAGFTSGIVQGCSNNGAVGYKHIGYNVGGIAGRQSGYILGCENYGFIQGRKDVGGIVGQAEPYILLHSSDSNLADLKSELNSLSSMINKFISDTDNLGNKAKNHLDGISKYAETARNSTQSLIDETADFADDNIAEINAEAAILSNTLDKLEPVFENLENGGKDLGDAIDSLNATIKDLNLYAPDLGNEVDSISSALTYISKSEYSISKAATKASRALDDLDNAITVKNNLAVRNALYALSGAIDDIINAQNAIEKSLSEIEKILNSKPDDFSDMGLNVEEITEILKDITKNTSTILTSLKTAKESLDIITLGTEINFGEFKLAAKNLKSSIEYLGDAMQYITKGLGKLGTALSDFSDKFEEYANEMSDELSKGKENLTKSLDSLSYAAEDITDALADMKTIISDLADEEPLEFVKLGDDFRAASDGLFDSLAGISDELKGLKNTISDETDKISNNLKEINNKFNIVMNLLIGEVEELKNGAQTLSDIFVDVSEEDINSVRQGKIESCKNSGLAEADRNTGGIAGNMAIEYSKDPEDDIEKPTTLNFTYRTRAILQSCINEAKVTGKKDCTGGILGKAEIGTVYECENYGDTESTNGNYVGGIVGKSDSSIKKCYAKSKVTGKRYIGGIAGKASTVTSSYTIVNVCGDENLGACCGEANTSNIFNNFYVNNGLGAVDGVSYKGHGEEISYDTLKNINKIPSRFISFCVTFVADGNTVETQDIKYGSETNRIKFPDAPKKDGHFGKWQKPEAETVTENITIECEYHPYIIILASDRKNESGKLPIALAEGEFTDEARLHINDSSETPPVRKIDSVSVFNISLTDTDIKENDSVTIRLLNENKDKVSAWHFENGKWEKLNVTKKGKYVLVELVGTKNTVCLQYDKKSSALVWIIPLVLIFACGAAFVVIRKKQQKK